MSLHIQTGAIATLESNVEHDFQKNIDTALYSPRAIFSAFTEHSSSDSNRSFLRNRHCCFHKHDGLKGRIASTSSPLLLKSKECE
ncbi:hypothetical protein ACLKMY_27075 [Paraburkholderia mimosarum]|uniref:hypothetical protein n=1 Tax=Paraburkholderia mimosarum TaxID=312026 RepID=UPI0039C34936